MRILIGSITILLVLQACFSYAKVIKKVKHVGHHHHKAKRALEAFDVTNKDECVDHSYCTKYSQMDCATFFVKNNCKALCGLCGQRRMVKLPMVLYYNKQKAAAKKHVVRRAAKGTYRYPPTTSQKLFDYVGGYNHWNFQFTDKHPIQMDWSKPQPFAKYPDQTSNQANTQQDQQAAQSAPAADQPSYQAAPAKNNYAAPAESAPAASAYPAAQNAFQPQTASPDQSTYQNQQPAAAAATATSTGTQTNDDTTTIKLPNSALNQADKGKDVYVALVDENKQSKPSYTLTSVQNDEPQKQKDDNPIQSFNYKPVKVKCPPGQECNYKGPNAPQVNQTFMVYCDDRFPSCGVLHSSCNDSWLQVYCPKRCNLCRPEDQQQTKPMQLDSTQQTNDQLQQTQYGNKVYPTKVTELKEDSPKMESELVAPEPGAKAERARYTLHVTPKLKDGIPQTQEILIMPPSAVPGSDVKPLVILKQKVTKPMVENIEIDVPPKGTKYSDEPKVEVIEGNKHESLNVVGGQADLSQAEADLEAGKTYESQDATPTPTTPAQTTVANATTQGNYNWTTTPAPATAASDAVAAPAQQPAAQTQAAQPAQDTQSQYSQTQTQSYQDTQTQATQTQAAQPAQSYQDTQPAQSYQDTQTQASQTQAAQPEATQTQATQDQAQPQAAQTTQSYAQAQTSAAPTAAPASTQAAAYPAQQDSQQTYTAAQTCSDDARCVSYTKEMCNQNWLQDNCKSKCKLC